jgi:N-acetyl-anhydromuramyl-L-alanine amidase AmpD
VRRKASRFLSLLFLLAGCRAAAAGGPGRWPAGGEIVVSGQRFAVAAPVVLWTQEPRYDAYREGPRFAAQGPTGKRYRPGREARDPELAARVEREGWTLANLREQVDLLVLHYDVCGVSRECFRVLQDVRQLSVHFLLDVDGTIYQTLDLSDQAWHARAANPRSIGVEIAHIGAYPADERAMLERWYEWTEEGMRLALPARLGDGGVRTGGFQGRPARPGLLRGPIHGQEYLQYDFTPEQYRSLAALAATLSRVLPQIELDAPRDGAGRVRTDALSDQEQARFRGVLGHYHLQADKRDPGPALDWETFLAEARTLGTEP